MWIYHLLFLKHIIVFLFLHMSEYTCSIFTCLLHEEFSFHRWFFPRTLTHYLNQLVLFFFSVLLWKTPFSSHIALYLLHHHWAAMSGRNASKSSCIKSILLFLGDKCDWIKEFKVGQPAIFLSMQAHFQTFQQQNWALKKSKKIKIKN